MSPPKLVEPDHDDDAGDDLGYQSAVFSPRGVESAVSSPQLVEPGHDDDAVDDSSKPTGNKALV